MRNTSGSPNIVRVAVIGGGFCGTMLAVQLVRQSGGTVPVLLIERNPMPGRGVAYGTEFHEHLLNVRARNMSAYADDPDHFVRWAQTNYNSSIKPDEYLPRPFYGRYVMAQLREAQEAYPGQLRCIRDEATSVDRRASVTEVGLASGQTILADKVVLALGNFPPRDLQIPGKTTNSSRFVNNPWLPSALLHAEADSSVLLIGSGLTCVDVILELRVRGFCGTIHVLSRRGIWPHRHQLVTPLPTPSLEPIPCTARGLLRFVRRHVAAAEEHGWNWRSAIDSLRPLNQKIWQRLPNKEKRRFLRHLRTYWDVHRHRIAGSVADQLSNEIRNGQVKIHAGRLTRYYEFVGGACVAFQDRCNGEAVKLQVDRVINCTGPDSDFRNFDNPLITSLFRDQLARPDELSLGLDVSETGAVLDCEGKSSEVLYALGPLRKGKLWESIAVPELREQVAALASLLIANVVSGFEEKAELVGALKASV